MFIFWSIILTSFFFYPVKLLNNPENIEAFSTFLGGGSFNSARFIIFKSSYRGGSDLSFVKINPTSYFDFSVLT